MKQSRRPPTPEHPLGQGKAIYFWSFLVAVMLFTVGGMYSLYEGAHKLQHPEPLQQWGWAVGVLVFAIVVEGYSTYACLQEAARERQGRSLWRWFRESRQAELIVIVGENIAALLGLVFALVAVVVSVLTGDPLWDALGTLAIGALLIVVAVFVAVEIKAMLVGQSADPSLETGIREFLQARPEIDKVLNLITLQLGSEVMLTVQVVMRSGGPAGALGTRIDAIEVALKQAFPIIRWTFVEPDVNLDS